MRRNLIRRVLMAGLWGWGVSLGGEAFHNDPISKYDRRPIEGFTVLLSPRLREHPEVAASSLEQLSAQLAKIARIVPPGPLAELRKARIWLECDETAGLGEFHWGPDTLRRQDRNPEKSRSVEITNARHLVEWSDHQPWVVLHELAHSYHCTVLGESHPGMAHAYDHAMKSGKYDQVDYVRGGKRPAYAKNNKAEYFAELTEAYFGKNDFEPYTKPDLERFDPVGYQLMVDVWGLPVGRADD